jgi:hypothetical protein
MNTVITQQDQRDEGLVYRWKFETPLDGDLSYILSVREEGKAVEPGSTPA